MHDAGILLGFRFLLSITARTKLNVGKAGVCPDPAFNTVDFLNDLNSLPEVYMFFLTMYHVSVKTVPITCCQSKWWQFE
ncbi:hypothetical protein I7I48_09435 [Histoplasma ohiense]|nr:hypothetical protein I7I48_09435 [Histoplasma ohiense (nom. inval.)]